MCVRVCVFERERERFSESGLSSEKLPPSTPFATRLEVCGSDVWVLCNRAAGVLEGGGGATRLQVYGGRGGGQEYK